MRINTINIFRKSSFTYFFDKSSNQKYACKKRIGFISLSKIELLIETNIAILKIKLEVIKSNI